MKNLLYIAVLVLSGSLLSPQVFAQGGLLKKTKLKLQKSLLKDVVGEEEEEKKPEVSKPTNNPSVRNQPRNNTGGKMTPPDVMENITDAENSYQDRNFSDTRFAVQQALHGVELEIGYEVLNSLPKDLQSIPFIEEEDQVVSSGIGFAGMTIGRKYTTSEQSVDLTIANNSAFVSAANMYIANPSYASSDENQKVVKTDQGRAYLEYDDYSGYKLSLPIGQSSILILECVNFADDDTVVRTVNSLDVARIKELLGEH